MKKIRKGVFETNSSSTHSICVAKDMELIIPEKLHFGFGEFGWEEDRLSSIGEKASYLYTGLFSNQRNDDIEKIISILKSKGIDITVEEPIYTDGSKWASNEGYVDHANELTEFLDAICTSEEKLMSFLFSPFSFILTGNDNEDSDIEINVDYDHYEYEKWN